MQKLWFSAVVLSYFQEEREVDGKRLSRIPDKCIIHGPKLMGKGKREHCTVQEPSPIAPRMRTRLTPFWRFLPDLILQSATTRSNARKPGSSRQTALPNTEIIIVSFLRHNVLAVQNITHTQTRIHETPTGHSTLISIASPFCEFRGCWCDQPCRPFF